MQSNPPGVRLYRRIFMPEAQILISLLGTLEINRNTENIAIRHTINISAAKPRQVLAILAANVNTMISTDQMIDELWPDGPPATVKTIVQTYIYQLRKQLGGATRSARDTPLLVTRLGGYMLALPHDSVDIFRFERLVERGKAALRDHEPGRAADLLGEAIALWRGPALADVACGPTLCPLAVYLEEERLAAVSMRIDAELANNRHREVVSELRRLVASHQLHESFYIRLMRALHQSGRRGEALTVYQQLRRVLDQDLGLEPSPEAQQVQHEILRSA